MSDPQNASRARQVFEEADRLFAQEGGQLWGISLEGPLLLVDLDTRDVAANQSDAQNMLTRQDDIWIGTLPPDVVVANTAMTWAGVYWTTLLWQSIPEDPMRRARFVAHEAFHRVQDQIGFQWPEIPNANTHLDRLDGRIGLQLEWRALASALAAEGSARDEAVTDALCFRAARRARFPAAREEERALEMHEGLAEYTGVRLSHASTDQAVQALQTAPSRYTSFVRSFAYASGPAYGLLLDAACPGWPRQATPHDDLGNLLKQALNLALPDAAEAVEQAALRAPKYDGEELRSREIERQRQRDEEIASYRARLLEGPVLILPISSEVQCAFDPRTAVPIPNSGTVFPFVQLRDAWGFLEVKQGGLWMDEDWRTAHVPVPESQEGETLRWAGGALQLAPGWDLQPADSLGRLILTQDRS